jgi:hypothetical protein
MTISRDKKIIPLIEAPRKANNILASGHEKAKKQIDAKLPIENLASKGLLQS